MHKGMLVELEGGCRVVGLKDGAPTRRGDLLIWQHFSSALSLRVLELHGTATLHNEEQDEVLYVLGEDVGIHLPARTTLELEGEKTIVACVGTGFSRSSRLKPAATRI